MLNTKISLLLFSALLWCQAVFSQANVDKMGDLLPPAPNASAIVKYGEITLSKNTGVPNISIPLYTVKNNKLSATVSIGYSSQGIRVDEIASRVGMGWALNAGGVITRTVRGTADDLNTRHLPYAPIATNWSTYNYMKRIGQSTSNYGNAGGYDAEPDLFNYNFDGGSGKFILDSNLAVMQIPVSTNKIYYNFSGTDWNFKIVAPNGVIYYFGGTGAVEKTKREQICSKLFDTYITTAWYLKKIEHPNGSNIRFVYTSHTYKYDNGTSQTMYWVSPYPKSGGLICTVGGPPTLSNTTCINQTVTQGVLLSEIIIDNNSKVQFTYTTRDDCEDKLVSKVEWIDLMSNTTVGSFDLNYSTVTANASFANGYYTGYNKTPYLTSLVENSEGNTIHKTHYFKYNDPAGRAPRLSYSQDHWGYFNGEANTSLVAKPDLYLQERFPYATANREPVTKYALKGMLSKVIYPTGGMDTLLYEGNDVLESISPRPQHRYTCEVTGTSTSTQVTKTRSFDLDENQWVELNINCIDNTGNGGFDPLHNKGRVEILNSSNSVVFTELLTPGTTVTKYVSIASGTYTLKLYANGTVVTTRATLKHYPVSGNLVSTNKQIGGLRIKYIIRGNEGETPSITRYHYAHLTNLNLSSQTSYVPPVYLREFNHTGWCTNNSQDGTYAYEAYALQSNTIISMNDYNASLVSYRGVVESQGENFENGGIYSKFSATSDTWGNMLMGEQINNAPKSNFGSVLNGYLLEETTFKKVDNTIVPLLKTINAYKIDSRNAKTDYGYYVHDRNGPLLIQPDTTCDLSYQPENANSCYRNLGYATGAFDMLKYEIMTRWVYVDTSTTIAYNQNGQNPVTTTKLFFYDSASHMQLTRTEETDSKGNTRKELFKYAHNFQGTQVYADMISKNIISDVVEHKTFENSNELTQAKTNYAEWASGNFEPSTTQSATRGNTLETGGTVNLYDKSGNVLQFTGKDGIITSYLWGYKYLYPVAKVVGATYAEVIATLSVDTAQLQSLDGTALRTELHRIRTGLTDAMVTTLTYKHLSGATSITDVNNRTATYYYDAFHRLRVIRDQDSNIVKKIDYSYATPDSNAVFAPYLNADTTGYSNTAGCQNGYVPSQVAFNVPAGMFFSFVSVADAKAKARAYLIDNQQAVTTANGYCDNTLTCSGVDKKLIDCLCITGWKTYIDTYQNSNGTWTCIYKYYFPDNTWSSQQYSEINSSPCGAVE